MAHRVSTGNGEEVNAWCAAARNPATGREGATAAAALITALIGANMLFWCFCGDGYPLPDLVPVHDALGSELLEPASTPSG